MTGVWKLLAVLFGALRGQRRATTAARSDAMIAAARRLLEREFEEHVQEVVRHNRSRVRVWTCARVWRAVGGAGEGGFPPVWQPGLGRGAGGGGSMQQQPAPSLPPLSPLLPSPDSVDA